MSGWIQEHFGSRLYEAVKQWMADDAGLLAASVSYYAALSIFPLLLVLISGMGLVMEFTPWGFDVRSRILAYVAESSSQELSDQVARLLSNVQEQAAVGGPLGLLTLLLTSLALFSNFQSALDKIWKTPDKPNRGYLAAVADVLYYRFRSFLMLLGVAVLILLTFIAGLAFAGLAAALPESVGNHWLWRSSQILVTIMLNFMLATILIGTLPKSELRWSEAAQGGALVSVIWEIGRQILSTWVIGGRYGAYGVVGAFIAMLLWMYYATSVFFLGAEYSRIAYLRRTEQTGKHRTQSAD